MTREENFMKKENIRKIIVHLCQTQHGVTEIAKVIY